MCSIRPASTAALHAVLLQDNAAVTGDDELPAYSDLPEAGASLSGPPPASPGPDLLPPPSALPLTARTFAPPPTLPAEVLEGPLWDSHRSVALDAIDVLMEQHPRGLGAEDTLFQLARTSPLAAIRLEAIKSLGTIPSVRAVDRLLELFWWERGENHDQADFHLSPGAVQDLCFAAQDSAEDINRCLRDLVLYSPSDTSVPNEAILALRIRSETSRVSACDALCDVAVRCPDPELAMAAREALQACATEDDWRDHDYAARLSQSVALPER